MKLSRRDAIQLLAAPFAMPLEAQISTPRPFKIAIPQATISRILKRAKETRLPDHLDAPDWRYGANSDYMKSLVDYWVTRFDWRKAEANLNKHPQFQAKKERIISSPLTEFVADPFLIFRFT